MVRGLLSTRHSSSLVCLTAHSLLPAASPSSSSCLLVAPGSPCAGAGAATFFRRASLCIRVQEHGGAGFRSGLRSQSVGRTFLGARVLSSRRGGTDAVAVGVLTMKRDPMVCGSASSSASETSSSSENVQAPPKVRVTDSALDCNLSSGVEFTVELFDWIVSNLTFSPSRLLIPVFVAENFVPLQEIGTCPDL